MRMTLVLALGPLMLLTAFAGCMAGDDGGDDDDGGGEANHVELSDNEFEEEELTVTVGTTVTFENVGDSEHTVTIHHPPDPPTTTLHDEELPAGNSTQFTFEDTGTFHVWCRYHGTMLTGMAMVVTVEE